MTASKKGWLDRNWPFRHLEVKLNTDTDLIKLVAMITMLIDHLGAAVFPQYRTMRIIGRIAFPLYAYCIAAGCAFTHDIGKYLQRVVTLALLVQPIYVLAMHHTNGGMFMYRFAEHPLKAAFYFYVNSWKYPSILLTLTVGIVVIWTVKERRLWLTALLVLLAYLLKQYLDYGILGVFLMVLLYLFINRWYVSLPIVTAFLLYWGLQGSAYTAFGVRFGIQMFALLALPLIYIPMRSTLKLPRWVFYSFYPAHLLVILLIEYAGDLAKLLS